MRVWSAFMARPCSRPGCVTPASATLGYDYATSSVWLDDLSNEAHPATHDLCDAHADRFGPPRGWQLRNRRRPLTALAS